MEIYKFKFTDIFIIACSLNIINSSKFIIMSRRETEWAIKQSAIDYIMERKEKYLNY